MNAVDHPAGGILVDPFHHERVGHDPEKIREIPERWLSYAQLCDMPECGVVTDPDAYYIDAIDGRLAPGEGSVPVAAMAMALPADLPISLEIRSLHYRETYRDPLERARAILAQTQAFFTQHGLCRALDIAAAVGAKRSPAQSFEPRQEIGVKRGDVSIGRARVILNLSV